MLDPLLQLPLLQSTAQISHQPIYYVQRGAGDLVIFVHGSLCDLRYWRWQLNKLYTNCQAVALSLPGYWPNNPSTSAYLFSVEHHIQAIADVISTVRQPEQKVFLVGHSRGAYIALKYVQQYVNIDGLVLADPSFMLGQPTPVLPVLDQAASLLETAQDEEALALFIDAVSGNNTWRQMVGWFKTMVIDNSHTLIAQSREPLDLLSVKSVFPLKAIPVLIISGEHSPQRYQNSVQCLLRHLPDTQHVVIANASHGMNLANPKAFNKAIVEFIF